MRLGLFSITRVALLSALTCSMSSYADTYAVKSGDTLSGIIWKHLKGPLYGKNGNLARVLDLNPKIKNPD